MDTCICMAEFPLLFIWNYQNIVNQLYPNTKLKIKKKSTESLLEIHLSGSIPGSVILGWGQGRGILTSPWVIPIVIGFQRLVSLLKDGLVLGQYLSALGGQDTR